MRYVGLVVGLGLLVLVALIVLGVLIQQRVLKPRREARWEAAKGRATWQDIRVDKDGKTTILVQRIAVDGNRREVLDEQFIGLLYHDDPAYTVRLDKMWAEALQRVYQLNTGPLS
jgi:heme exporter protein D